jgi:hypothetical protein
MQKPGRAGVDAPTTRDAGDPGNAPAWRCLRSKPALTNMIWQSGSPGCGKTRSETKLRSTPLSADCFAGPLLPYYMRTFGGAEKL